MKSGKFHYIGYYRCGSKNNLGKNACDNITLRADDIEKSVLMAVEEKIFTKDNLVKIARELNKNRDNILNESNKDTEKRISNLLKSIEKSVDEDTAVPRINELKDKKKALILGLTQIEEEIPYEFNEKDIEEVVKIIQEGLSNSDPRKLNVFFENIH